MSSTYAVLSVSALALLLGAGNTFTTRFLITALPCDASCAPPGAAAGARVSFDKPVFTALLAFAGMAASGLWYLRGCLRGAERDSGRQRLPSEDADTGGGSGEYKLLALSGAPTASSCVAVAQRYRPLALPAMLDVMATILQAAASLFIPAAVNAAVRGSILLFTALANRMLGVRDASAGSSEWRALGVSVLGVGLVGLASILNSGQGGASTSTSSLPPIAAAVLGVSLALASNVVQAVQVAYETLYLEGAIYEPVEANAAEGALGVVVCAVLLAAFQLVPAGSDGSGHVEDTAQTLCCLSATPPIAGVSALLWALFAGSTVAHMALSSMRGSLYRSFILCSRAVLVWGMEACAHVASGGTYGSGWQAWSWLEAVGFALLLVGGVAQFRAQSRREAAARESSVE